MVSNNCSKERWRGRVRASGGAGRAAPMRCRRGVARDSLTRRGCSSPIRKCGRFERRVPGGVDTSLQEGLSPFCSRCLPAGERLCCQQEFSPRKFLLPVWGWERKRLPAAGRAGRAPYITFELPWVLSPLITAVWVIHELRGELS